jgi:MIP family channel proteins
MMKLDVLRRYAAELIGTFALIFVGCGTRDMVGDTHDPAGILVVHLAFGLTVATMIYTLSYLSSAHFNPAITLGFAIARRFPWRQVPPFWLAQFLGAILAVSVHVLLIPTQAPLTHYGATIPKVGLWQALGVEVVLTFFLMFVSMGTATDKRFIRANSGVTVGFVIIIAGLFGNSLSGASMNPARSLGPALFAGGDALTSLWLYFVGPLLGAALAAGLYELIRGGEENAKDVLEEFPVQGKRPDLQKERR